jgi:glucuronokinase
MYLIITSILLLLLLAFPQQVLDIELVELGIAAGLQDRVIQTRGGFVHMDFSEEHFTSFGTGVYTDLDKSLLPKLYVAFNIDVGKCMHDVYLV